MQLSGRPGAVTSPLHRRECLCGIFQLLKRYLHWSSYFRALALAGASFVYRPSIGHNKESNIAAKPAATLPRKEEDQIAQT
jgi:hypothetical protein